MTLMTQSDFAKHRGVGKPAVSNWKKAGLLVIAEGEGGRLMVDVERTEARLNARLDPMRGRPTSGAPAAQADEAAPAPSGAAVASLTSMRGEKLQEELIAQRLKNATAAGELVARDDAERRYGGAMQTLRERLHGQFRGLAERLAAEAEPRSIMSLAEALIDKVFAEVADEVAKGLLDRDDDDDAADAEQAEAA